MATASLTCSSPKDTEDVTIQLLRSEEPPAAWNPGTAPSGEEKRALARRILLRFWEVNNKNTDARSKNSIATRCVLCMARIDPELARTWSEQFGGQLDSDISLAEAEVAAEADAQTAIALINQTPGLASQEQLQDLAQRFVDSDAKKALLFVEEAAVQARALDEPVRARARARCRHRTDQARQGGCRKEAHRGGRRRRLAPQSSGPQLPSQQLRRPVRWSQLRRRFFPMIPGEPRP